MRLTLSAAAMAAAGFFATPADAAFILVSGSGSGQAYIIPSGFLPDPSNLRNVTFSFSYIVDLDQPGGGVAITDTSTSASVSIAGNPSTQFSFNGTGFDLLSGGTGTGIASYNLAQFRGGGVLFERLSASFGTTRIENYTGPVGFLGVSVAVPEPASWAMMIAGFAIVGIALRKRHLTSASSCLA